MMEQSAAERLRAFEDEKLGKDAPRESGRIEKGRGSLYERMSDGDKGRYVALEKLAEVETKLAAAKAAVEAAKAEYDAAVKAAEAKPEEPAAPTNDPAPAAEDETEESPHGGRQHGGRGRR